MNIYIPLSIILVFLCFVQRNNKKDCKYIFLASFFALLVFSALRYNFGADYQGYLSDYRETRTYGYDSHFETELLFGLFMVLFPNYTSLIVTLSLLWFGSVYILARSKVDTKYFWLFLLYILFTEECVIDSWVALRSSLCMVLFILSVKYITEEKRIIGTIILVSCCFIHLSSVVFLPFIFLGQKSKKLFTSIVFICVIVFLGLYTAFSGKGEFYLWLSTFLSDNTEHFYKYTQYLETTNGSIDVIRTLAFRLLTLIPFLYLLYGLKKEKSKDYIVYYQISLIACSLTFIFGSGMISRFLIVMNPFFIVSLIRTIKYTRKEISVAAVFCVLFVSLYTFSHIMDADYNASLRTYKTIFSAPKIP